MYRFILQCTRTLFVLLFTTLIGIILSSGEEVWAQLSFTINSPSPNDCVPNNPAIQPGGSPDEPGVFQASPVPFTFTVVEPNGDDVTLSATINGTPVTLTNNTVFTDGPGIPTTIDYFAINGDQVVDAQGLTLVINAESPAGFSSDVVTFDLDRTPPSLEFSPADLALLNSCHDNAASLLNTITPNVVDDFDTSPVLSTLDLNESCTLTRVFTVQDHCGEGNSQEVYFQIKKPSAEPAEFYYSGAEDGEFYLETYSYFGVTDGDCFDTNGVMSVDGGSPTEFTTGTFLNEPGSYALSLTATDCAGTQFESNISFELLEKPFAATGGPYQGVQGQILTLDGGESFSPPELGGIIEYAWDFDLFNDNDGGYRHIGETVDFVDDNGEPIDDGTYTIGLRITTQAGQVEYDNTEVVIADAPPVCDAGGPYEIEQGLFLTFDGSGSRAGSPNEPILAYRWHFGEFPGDLNEQFAPGLTAPEHFYLDEGEYTVTLTAYDIDSTCTAEATVTVIDVEPIVRDLRVLGEPPYLEGSLISFSAGTTTAGSPAEPIIQFIWEWGDSTPNTSSAIGEELRRPSHRYNDSGSFNVCLSVDDSDSLVTGCIPIEVTDLRPIARLTGDLFAIEGDEAYFSITGTRAGGEADPLSFALIDWGDGSAPQRIEDFTQTDLTHRFEANGNLVITMSLFDEEQDDPVTTTLEIYVDDVSPIPNLSAPLIVEEGVESQWSAVSSQAGAPSDPIVSYRWDWGDGSAPVEGPESERAHIYADNGVYQLRLTVIDSDHSLSTITRFVNVENRAPYNAVISTPSDVVDFGEPVRFEVSYEDVINDFVTISWRMGEGSTYSNQRVVTHTYRELGVFTVRATLNDEDGGETIVSFDIEVSPAGPRIIIPELEPISEGELLSFEVELRAAEASDNSIDGPVDLRVLRSPQGMQVMPLESANPRISNRFRFTWQTDANSSGEYLFSIMGLSPSGITRVAEQVVVVTEAKQHVLATLGGSTEGAMLSLFRYTRDVYRELTSLERFAAIEVGRGVGQVSSVRDQYYVTVPGSARVAVISESEGRLLRRIPVSGEPYAIAEAQDYIWVFDARRPQLVAIDRRLKVYRRAIIDHLESPIIAAQRVTINEEEKLMVLTADQTLLLLDPEAYISNQPSRAVLKRFALSNYLGSSPSSHSAIRVSAPALGGFILRGDELIVYVARGIFSFSVNELETADVSPNWAVKTHNSIRGLTAHQGSLWSVSMQGLRRFDWPQEGQGLNGSAALIRGAVIDLNQQSAITSLPNPLMGEPTLITATPRQVNHLGSESLRHLLVTPDLNPQRIMVIERQRTE